METCDRPVLFQGHSTIQQGPETALWAAIENVLEKRPCKHAKVGKCVFLKRNPTNCTAFTAGVKRTDTNTGLRAEVAVLNPWALCGLYTSTQLDRTSSEGQSGPVASPFLARCTSPAGLVSRCGRDWGSREPEPGSLSGARHAAGAVNPD